MRKEGSRLLTYAATGEWATNVAARGEILDLLAWSDLHEFFTTSIPC